MKIRQTNTLRPGRCGALWAAAAGLAVLAGCAASLDEEEDPDRANSLPAESQPPASIPPAADLTSSQGAEAEGQSSGEAAQPTPNADPPASGPSPESDRKLGAPTSPADPNDAATSEPDADAGATVIDEEVQELLVAHNEARQAVGIDPPMAELTWSEEAAALALDWAETLMDERCEPNIRHRTANNPYGENIAVRWSAPPLGKYPGSAAVAGWVQEIACWDYGTISGTERCEPVCIQGLNSTGCGHYTQVVWEGTEFVGCGYASCNDDQGGTWETWVCNYGPPGNIIGRTPY